MKRPGTASLILGIVTLVCVAAPAFAGKTTYWIGGGGNNLWTNPANWNNGVPTSGTDDYVYIGTNGASYVVDMTGAANPNIHSNRVTIMNATITNGLLIAYKTSGADAQRVGSGWIYCSNTWFANSSGIGGGYVPQTTLISCRYNSYDGKYVENRYGSSSLTIKDPVGEHFDVALYRLRPDYAANVSLTFDGGIHRIGVLEVCKDGANANRGLLTITNGAVVRMAQSGGTSIGMTKGVGSTWAEFRLHEGSYQTDDQMEFGPYMNLSVGPSGLRTLKYRAEGNLDYFRIRMTNEWQWNGEGLTIDFQAFLPASNTQTMEMCAQDLGPALTNFHDNYSIDGLILRSIGGNMKLIDAYTNNWGIAGNEVLYVDHIALSNNITVNFDNKAKIYYKKLTTNSYAIAKLNEPVGGGLIQVTGASLSRTNGTIHSANVATLTNGNTLAVGADYGTRYVSGFSAGAPVGIYLDVTGSQANIDALRVELGARVWTEGGSDMLIEYPGAIANGGSLFFDWNFSHRSVVLANLKAAPPPPTGSMILIR